MQKEWLLPTELSAAVKQEIKTLSLEMKCPRLVAELLYRKDLHTAEQIEGFFHPKMEQQHDPFLFPDMEKAVQRILTAIDTHERITIYGDYDVDGTTATTLLYLGLKRLGADIDFYIPHRMIDGYGLSLGSLDQLKEGGTSLIISVDCGVNALEEIAAINAEAWKSSSQIITIPRKNCPRL